MKDKAERSTHKTNVYMGRGAGGGGQKAWDTLGPDLPMNITEERDQLRLETIVLLQPLFSYILSISYSLSLEQRGSFGCLDFCKCFTHLVVFYHLDRMLHRGFFSPP